MPSSSSSSAAIPSPALHNGELMALLSHEFRTPLTSIKGFAETLLRYHEALPPAEQQRFLRIIIEQADRLSRLVESLLALSKVEEDTEALPSPSSPRTARALPLKPLVEKVWTLVSGKHAPANPKQAPKRLVWEASWSQWPQQHPQAPLEVWADADTLEQILVNLLDNAYKYSPALGQGAGQGTEGAPITVGVALQAPEGEEPLVSLSISDQGIGLSPEQQEQLFTRFYRASTHLTQSVEGTGLGLYITKTLVQRLGGTIAVQSTLGQGSTFSVALPLATPAKQQQALRHSIALGGIGGGNVPAATLAEEPT
jgi:two-component system phosphate regulon sensor histidine kinase PhoR